MYIQKQDIFRGNGYHDWKLSSLAITAKSLITMIGLFQIIFSIFKQSYNVDLLSDFNNHKVHFLAFWTHVTFILQNKGFQRIHCTPGVLGIYKL